MTDDRRCFEDLRIGERFALGPKELRAEEAIAFARAFDPQPFHLDEQAARRSPLGALSASGWHTAAVMMRLFCDSWLFGVCGRGSPGLDLLEWPTPVFFGDVIRGEGEVVDLRQSGSRPHLGLAHMRIRMTGRGGAEVLRMACWVMVGRRQPVEREAPVAVPRHQAEPVSDPNPGAALKPGASMLWLHSLPMGCLVDLGDCRISAEEIVAFAGEFDPQPFHLDEQAARDGPFGGLAASGWHSCALWMRANTLTRAGLLEGMSGAERDLAEPSGGVGVGVRDLAWLRPVYAGDTLRSFITPVSSRASRSMPGWGIANCRADMVNGDGRPVLRFFPSVLIRRHPDH